MCRLKLFLNKDYKTYEISILNCALDLLPLFVVDVYNLAEFL